MGQILLQKFRRRLKPVTKSATNLVLFIRSVLTHKAGGTKRVKIELEDNRFHRYAYCLAKWFEREGYAVSVECPLEVVRSQDSYPRLLAIEGFVSRVRVRGNQSRIKIYNDGEPRVVKLNSDYFSASMAARLPMPMHPLIYHFGWSEDVERLRESERRIGVLYAGVRGDSTNLVSKAFGLLKREDVLTHLLESSPHAVRPLACYDGLEALLEGGPLVFAIRDVANIPQKDLLPLMAASDFFLALPGYTMPQAHNLTECMSVGTIPITQYGAYLDPPLEHGRTCLVFDDFKSLDEMISEALRLPEPVKQEMRRNVIRYYEDHLSSKGAVRLLETAPPVGVMLIAEETSVAELS